ncbi:hypothetical protein EQM14_05675 [Caproiciproducens sp. NJN-50]|uniref:Pycsar system effector family protein n=1 Tax=Acutalibacteraceae TaxID=3082771 RepID=UPI000FFE3015|nr:MULTISPECIES: Pycsar system effector family protein [Acutalibacteraceae]QAT49308.1 hypothetical protein EQM14_05675 [Caproiciproducens sp. NJN-50]
MENKRSREELNEVLDRNTAWIENCDSKTSIILGGIGVIVGILLASDYIGKFKEINKYMVDNTGFWTVLYLIVWLFSIFGILVGCVFLIYVLISKINPNEFSNKGIKADSLIYFSTIAQFKSYNDYRQKLNKYDTTELNDDITSQIYICSLICKRKFMFYKAGLTTSLSSFTLFVLMTIIGLFIV